MEVIMPQLGETVAEGRIEAWFKQPGDEVREGEPLFVIETDKVSMEVQALASGKLSEIRVPAGASAPVGAIVAVIGATQDGSSSEPANAAVAALAPAGNGSTQSSTLDPYFEVRTPAPIAIARGANGLPITPLARRRLAETGIAVERVAADVAAAGRRRITRADVERALRAPAEAEIAVAPVSAPAPPPVVARAVEQPAPRTGAFDVLELNRIRRKAGEHLAQAWREIPHVTQGVEVNFQRVERARAALNADRRGGEAKLTFLPFIARAVCLAIRDYPQVNATLNGESLHVHRRVNLGIAVDLDHDGLVVPVVRDADSMTVRGLARAIQDLNDRARTGRLSADDLAGATYSISNSGTFGTLFTTPIINPPQVAILSTDGISKRPVVIEDPEGDRLSIARVGILAQSFDHRAFDGAYSAAFLRKLRQIIEMRDWLAEA
ncbi:dihydrolipoamide acetyltransferase family protein [Rhodoligotrophos defluvii]|uniref:dihydrolipoamide acetyltransferase family protein n=1 Tax=Rhodoligotrophos defluvii TaxID=2561934 RepID=UPI00148532A0|nr:dihydrolipoamide acetyltransferase family protein [Rhodoligotrophos defluvii]